MAGRFSIEAIFKAVDKMTAPIAKMQSRMERFTKTSEKGIKALDGAADKWLGSMKNIAVGAAAMGAAVSAGLALAAKPGMDFEQAITNVGAVSLMTRAQVADLEKEARRLGKTTKFSATEVAGGMELMGKAGFTNEQILATIGGALAAAAAEGAEFEEVAGIISNTLNGMGLEKNAKDTQRVADVLTLASARTNSSITSLGESMKNLAPVAKQFKIPFESAVASVALLQDVGIDASEAGTSMATMLTKLATPTDNIRAKMRSLGVTFQDAKGNMLPLEKVFANFGVAAKKSGGNMKTAAFFAELVGLRGQRAALNMQTAFKSGKFDELMKELGDAAGKAQEMADLRMDTFGGDLTKLKNTANDLLITLFDMESGPLRGVVKSMTAWVDKNGELVASGFGDFVAMLRDNMEGIVTWGTRIAKVVAVLTAGAVAIKVWTGAIALFEALVAISTVAFAGWAIAIVAAIALIWAFWPEISKFFTDLWEGIVDLSKQIGAAIYGWVLAVFNPIKDFLVGWFEFVVGIWTLVIGASMVILQPFFDWFIGKFGWIGDVVIAVWTGIWDGIVAIAKVSWDVISGLIGGYVDFVKLTWSTLTGFFTALWDGIKSIFMAVMGPVFEKIEWAIDKIRSIGRDTLGTNESEAGAASASPPQVIGPEDRASDRISRSISESTTRNETEVLIRDTTGKASMSRPVPGISLQSTGAF